MRFWPLGDAMQSLGGWIDKEKREHNQGINKDGDWEGRGKRQEKRKDFSNEKRTYHNP